jgi:hypothetical protein
LKINKGEMMALLRQVINGQRVNTINVDASDGDLEALESLLEGKIEQWKKVAEGGSAEAMPEVLNTQRYRVGKTLANNTRTSCLFRIFHIKLGKNNDDVKPLVVGKFDASWNVDEKCEYCDLVGDKTDIKPTNNTTDNK